MRIFSLLLVVFSFLFLIVFSYSSFTKIQAITDSFGPQVVVTGKKHQSGKGRHKGRVGSLVVRLKNGTTFEVGTGLSDADRDNPPPIGSEIKFKYQELTDGGVPRFPSFLGMSDK
jgi:hypothetical protein